MDPTRNRGSLTLQSIGNKVMMRAGRLLVKLGQQERLLQLMAGRMMSLKNKRRTFAGYEPLASDVFIATYSKSGTNWGMQIAQQIAYCGAAEFDHIHDLVAWPDTPMPFVKAQLNDRTIAERAPTGLRVIKTHWERPFVPYTPTAKYAIIVRDPKEVFVSGYHFAHAMMAGFGLNVSPEKWLDAFVSGRYMFGSWAEHTASWWACRDRDNVLLLNYGEMKRDSVAAIQQIAALLDVPLTETELAAVVEKSGFVHMKANAHRFDPWMPGVGRAQLIRSGRSGGSAELISAAQQQQIDAYCVAELQRLGSDFPYAATFGL